MFVRRLAFSMLVVSSLIGQLSCCLPLPIGKTRATRSSSTPDVSSTPYAESTPDVSSTPDFAATPAPGPTLELSVRPQQPSSMFNQYESKDRSFTIQVPANWDGYEDSDSGMTFAPKGAYGAGYRGPRYLSHGIIVSAISAGSADLRQASRSLIRQMVRSNAGFQITTDLNAIDFGGSAGYRAVISGPSPFGGAEINEIYTTSLSDGRIVYINIVVPEDEVSVYKPTFQKIINNLRLAK
jgi:hypothetical protein